MATIVDFYRGTGTDYEGRSLTDLWQWDNERLEMVHDFIQVLFPNWEPSGVNPYAPLLDDGTVAAFAQDETLRANLARSHDRMLRFYGLAYDAAGNTVRRRADFAERARNWLQRGNHNYLRITRILHCLKALGLEDRARAFLRCLEEIFAERGGDIGDKTLDYWRSAVA
jgi:hypothetical protein